MPKTIVTRTSGFASGLVCLLLLAAACSGRPTATDAPGGPGPAGAASGAGGGLSTVLLLGDSVAAGQAVPLTEAFAASDVRFQSIAAEGGGNVVGPFSDEHWKTLPERIAAAKPSVVIYQLTSYDWGSPEQQRAGYGRLLRGRLLTIR